MTKDEKNKLLIGIGIGVAVGGSVGCTVGYLIGRNRTEKRIRKNMKDNLRRAHDRGYEDGYDEGAEQATIEAQRWIDKNIVRVDASNPEEAQKALESYFKASEQSTTTDPSSSAEAVKSPLEGQIEASEKHISDNQETEEELAHLMLDQENRVVVVWHGEAIATYPRELFFYDNGETYGESQIRARLVEYEKNPKVLKRVWQAFGWGDYFPDPTLGCPTPEEIDNWDLEIDEKLGGEPEERTIARERYLDEVERYKENPESGPRIISRQEFYDECYLDKIYVDYYDEDNKFIENTDVDTPLDAYEYFGVSNGNELFGKMITDSIDDSDNDPDIVYIKNFKMNIVAEITRYHRSYASIVDGSAYLDGGTGIR